MAKPIRIIVKGTSNRGDDAPTVKDLLSQIQDHVEILEEVEGAISSDGDNQLVWRVTDVTKNSPITFEITPYPKNYGMDIEIRANTVVKATAEGLSDIAKGGSRPIHFTDKVLKKVETFNKRVTNGLAGTTIDFSNYGNSPEFDVDTVTAQATLTKIAIIKKPALQPHRELGSIEGYVKTVGRDGYGRPIIHIVTRLDKADVKCISNDSGLDKIGHLEVNHVIKGVRVRLHGMLYYKSPMVLDHIDVERTELFQDWSTLPKLFDLIDHGFTGGLDSVEYMKRTRADV